MNEQSKAIQMANLLNNEVIPDNLFADIEAELRRLDAENAALRAQQAPVSDNLIREVFLRNGFTVKEGQSDLKPYVFAAARDLLASAAPQQAPVDERDLLPLPMAYFHEYKEGHHENQPLYMASQMREYAQQARAALKPAAPEGYQLVAVKGLERLVYALERAERKGNLPYDFEEPWAEFDYQPLAAAKDGAA